MGYTGDGQSCQGTLNQPLDSSRAMFPNISMLWYNLTERENAALLQNQLIC